MTDRLDELLSDRGRPFYERSNRGIGWRGRGGLRWTKPDPGVYRSRTALGVKVGHALQS